jgi:hypothetical protein
MEDFYWRGETAMEKWIVVSFWEHRGHCGFDIRDFYSEKEAKEYSNTIKPDDLYCVAKVIQ